MEDEVSSLRGEKGGRDSHKPSGVRVRPHHAKPMSASHASSHKHAWTSGHRYCPHSRTRKPGTGVSASPGCQSGPGGGRTRSGLRATRSRVSGAGEGGVPPASLLWGGPFPPQQVPTPAQHRPIFQGWPRRETCSPVSQWRHLSPCPGLGHTSEAPEGRRDEGRAQVRCRAWSLARPGRRPLHEFFVSRSPHWVNSVELDGVFLKRKMPAGGFSPCHLGWTRWWPWTSAAQGRCRRRAESGTQTSPRARARLGPDGRAEMPAACRGGKARGGAGSAGHQMTGTPARGQWHPGLRSLGRLRPGTGCCRDGPPPRARGRADGSSGPVRGPGPGGRRFMPPPQRAPSALACRRPGVGRRTRRASLRESVLQDGGVPGGTGGRESPRQKDPQETVGALGWGQGWRGERGWTQRQLSSWM